ncbi:MAG TPA: DUF3261 domain-containing protein [Burkholderiaceae bacterium]
MTRALLMTLLLALAGCATQAPAPARLGLRLSPATLGTAIAVEQHLRVEREGKTDELDAALEVDAARLQLVGLAFGQRVLTVAYDGKELISWRHFMLPAQVRAEDVLEDIQLTLWPVEAVRAALPAGWTIDEQPLRRTVWRDGELVAEIRYSDSVRWKGIVVLDNRRYRYKLTIETAQQ